MGEASIGKKASREDLALGIDDCWDSLTTTVAWF